MDVILYQSRLILHSLLSEVFSLGLWVFLGLGVASCSFSGKDASEAQDSPDPIEESSEQKVITVLESGGRIDWSKTSGAILIDSKGLDEYYDIHLMTSINGSPSCITCDHPNLPNRHIGNPSWHPDGVHFVFQAEKLEHPNSSKESLPGFGRHSDLWLGNIHTGEVYQLTDTLNDGKTGVLHPHFSADGKVLVWSQMVSPPNIFKEDQSFGYWEIHKADVVWSEGVPSLENDMAYSPGGPAFYETHGIDGDVILFTSNLSGEPTTNNKICLYNIGTDELSVLADQGYNEHAQFTVDKAGILYMSNFEVPNKGTEYWLMNRDGSDKRQITFFNDIGHEMYRGSRVVAADNSFSPNGKFVLGYLQTNLLTQDGVTVLIPLE